MTGRSAAGPCGGGGGVCQWHLAARAAARDSPAGDGGRTDDVELLMSAAAPLLCCASRADDEKAIPGFLSQCTWREPSICGNSHRSGRSNPVFVEAIFVYRLIER